MTWHLKDRELEKKLIAIDPEFVDLLNNFVGNEPNNKIFDVRFSTDIKPESGFKKIFFVRFLASELTDEYDPQAWNEYPRVTPPYGVLMRIDFGKSNSNGYKAFYKHLGEEDVWCHADGTAMPGIYSDAIKRFRPWED